MSAWLAQPAGRDDPKLPVRLSARDFGRIEGLAGALGVSPSRLVRETAVRYGDVVAAEVREGRLPSTDVLSELPKPTLDAADEAAVGDEWVALPEWLAERTGSSVTAMARSIALGQVVVDGVVWRDSQIDAARLTGAVAVDGQSV